MVFYIFLNSFSYFVYSNLLHISRCRRCLSPHSACSEYAALESMLHFASGAHTIALNCCCELSKAQVGFCLNKTLSQKHGKCFCFDYTHTHSEHTHAQHTHSSLRQAHTYRATIDDDSCLIARYVNTHTRQHTHTHTYILGQAYQCDT